MRQRWARPGRETRIQAGKSRGACEGGRSERDKPPYDRRRANCTQNDDRSPEETIVSRVVPTGALEGQ